MKLFKYFYFLLLQLMFCSLFCYAQSNNQSQSSPNEDKKTEKKHTLNFEDELVEGTAQKPDLFYIFEKKNFNYKRLIRLRENFIPEMHQTSEDIKRLRGGR